jgi:DMSO reductase iron-sulfur subunit
MSDLANEFEGGVNATPAAPDYARLKPQTRPVATSQHGTLLDLDKAYPELAGAPLRINDKETRSTNPARYKQHGFHFNADNCIACHACESACSEKNNLPPHLAFRKVGYIEGGSWPDVRRLNVSMACNHCEDPVCLKACPTRAYTKYAEYGAVLQDPDICFGCGYCTWVCPYNAPQLDPVNGQVEKCNMCVDRLEQGLKPACVAACLGNALEFGVIEDLPQGREQVKLNIPGFPDPSISRPNIRFQQVRSLPPSFRRTDGVPVQYQRGAPGETRFEVKSSAPKGKRAWSFDKLSSRENPLVAFTLLSQFAVGAFLLLFLLPRVAIPAVSAFDAHPALVSAFKGVLVVLLAVALSLSASHLGKPHRFYRGFNNLRHSWLSREALALSLFFGAFSAYTLITVFPALTAWLPPALSTALPTLTGISAALLGPVAIYCMYRIYRIKARPFWDHWHTGAAFFASLLILGSLGTGLAFGMAEWLAGHAPEGLLRWLSLPLLTGLVLQAIALAMHLRYLARRGAEADVSRVQMLTTYGKTWLARWASLGMLTVGALVAGLSPPGGGLALILWGTLSVLAVVHEIVGRALFYVLVTPTTMPGAFFWNNKYFEHHARKTGLAQMPQVGVAPEAH